MDTVSYIHISAYNTYTCVHIYLKIIVKEEIMKFGRGTRKVGGNGGVELICTLGKNINCA